MLLSVSQEGHVGIQGTLQLVIPTIACTVALITEFATSHSILFTLLIAQTTKPDSTAFIVRLSAALILLCA